MTQSAASTSERFQPIPLRVGSSARSRLAFALRRFVDLQFLTIWRFLKPRLGRLKGHVLDVGCGEMPYRGFLPRDVCYTGIDVPQASAFSMRRSEEIVAFDGRSIPFPDSTFEAVMCTEVLEHSPDPHALVAEIGRVLKTGGTLLVTIPFSARVHYAPYDFHRFTKFALQTMFAAFENVRIEERGNDIAVIANKMIVVALRMTRLTRWSPIQWPLLLLMLPVAGFFLCLAHLTMSLGGGSLDDPLGYALTARKK